MAWQLFERDPAGYEAWYATPRGRRADRAERALLERLLTRFATAQSALEVGCGTGHFTRWLRGRLPRVVGLDRAPALLAEARRRRLGLPLVQGDAHRLPIRTRAVDLSVFVITLEFVEDPAQALAEAVRVARQGVLVVALREPFGATRGGRPPGRWAGCSHRLSATSALPSHGEPVAEVELVSAMAGAGRRACGPATTCSPRRAPRPRAGRGRPRRRGRAAAARPRARRRARRRRGARWPSTSPRPSPASA
ncbi:MAG: class I SAM-dependent methyltransferase [Candidatus Rokubacteria bacterium]|nr:class I SAM-dependent methyltransferase [Candidatus Rokubacteria bacterium]